MNHDERHQAALEVVREMVRDTLHTMEPLAEILLTRQGETFSGIASLGQRDVFRNVLRPYLGPPQRTPISRAVKALLQELESCAST